MLRIYPFSQPSLRVGAGLGAQIFEVRGLCQKKRRLASGNTTQQLRPIAPLDRSLAARPLKLAKDTAERALLATD
jgi:hypothetical protein